MLALVSSDVPGSAVLRRYIQTLFANHNQLTKWSRVLLEKLIAAYLVKKFQVFYRTRGLLPPV
jgi:hypothetical protein